MTTPSNQNLRRVLSLDGVDDYVGGISTEGFAVGDEPMSVFAWIKTSSKVRETIVSWGGLATRRAVTINVNQTITDHFQPDFYWEFPDSGEIVNDGQWHHVGFCYAGAKAIDIYVDGEAVSATLGGRLSIPSGSVAEIGRSLGGPHYFAGQIAELSVWKRALTGAEVRQVKSNALAGNEAGLVAYWPLNGDAKDASAAGRDGTVHGATFVEANLDFLQPAVADVKIEHVASHGEVKRVQSDEYVEIANDGRAAADISGWRLLSDGMSLGREQGFTFPADSTLAPGASVRVYTNEIHADTGGYSFASKTAIWRDGGDVATLYDAQGNETSRLAYGDKAPADPVLSDYHAGNEALLR